jgi:hypothetical protein
VRFREQRGGLVEKSVIRGPLGVLELRDPRDKGEAELAEKRGGAAEIAIDAFLTVPEPSPSERGGATGVP